MVASFKVSLADHDLIVEIAKRARRELEPELTMMPLVMDITAAHANGCPLLLRDLLDADLSNFAHDIYGIRRHIDRDTGKLTGCFMPRFADTST
ncbi:hypothetical protein [Bradyrhizobium sp. Leo121]|uniref:DUF6874 family protein n=1 Tax=Bradyrhizobium sp. Leo121 TaxID=1571195 RepID=UPI0010290E51|nr:hypothetical protein [Bradyrhizobium sp. Leo121]RZN30493.1 hypothetical protein CWO90_20365 [Bradyrhizobium sp. Leo121]